MNLEILKSKTLTELKKYYNSYGWKNHRNRAKNVANHIKNSTYLSEILLIIKNEISLMNSNSQIDTKKNISYFQTNRSASDKRSWAEYIKNKKHNTVKNSSYMRAICKIDDMIKNYAREVFKKNQGQMVNDVFCSVMTSPFGVQIKDLCLENKITREFKKAFADTEDIIDSAHTALTKNRFSLIGFHGCVKSDLDNMVKNGFQCSKIGINTSSLVRGDGFYVAPYHKIPRTWARIRMRKVKTPSEPIVLRIYVLNWNTLKHHVDFEWGGMEDWRIHDFGPREEFFKTIREDKEGYDKFKKSCISADYKSLNSDLELVLRPHIYKRIVAIPSKGQEDEKLLLRQWSSMRHEINRTTHIRR
ncbi:MAG: hypothetical protein GY710_21930 [Desulfobacteraceae bacterium]|nr:hypothetical protein [Desulfobacteraceae bacterium]